MHKHHSSFKSFGVQTVPFEGPNNKSLDDVKSSIDRSHAWAPFERGKNGEGRLLDAMDRDWENDGKGKQKHDRER